MTPHMHLYILASGSKGNAAVVKGPSGSVLVDCGITRKALRQRAAEVGCDLSDVRAILVTHEHHDHTSGLHVVCNHFDGPLYATVGTATGRRTLADLAFTLMDHDQELELCGMHVQAFPTSHDVGDPMCFRFEVRGPAADGSADGDEVLDAIGWVTDTGYVTSEAFDALYGCRILGIEANHDPRMLAQGPYPAFLKARIAGSRGHLSNEQAAEAVRALVTRETETVVALHISQENNRPSVAVRALEEALADPVGRGVLSVCAASQTEPLYLW